MIVSKDGNRPINGILRVDSGKPLENYEWWVEYMLEDSNSPVPLKEVLPDQERAFRCCTNLMETHGKKIVFLSMARRFA